MKIYIDNVEYNFSDDDLDSMYLGEGIEGTTYLLQNDMEKFAFKIHDEFPDKQYLSEQDCNDLTKISTSRIILPKKLIYDEDGKYIGYTKDYIEVKKFNLRKITVGDVIREFNLLEDDCQILCDNDVEIMDLQIDNTILSDGIYLCDPGSFVIRRSGIHKRFLKSFNWETMRDYEYNDIFKRVLKLKSYEIKALKQFYNYNDCYFVSEIFESTCDDYDENFKQYIKRLTLR